MLPVAMEWSMVAIISTISTPIERGAHPDLRLRGIGDDVRHGPVIANRAGQYEVHVVLDALVHDAFLAESACSTASRSDPAERMVLMAAMWLRCPPGTGWPLWRATPSEVPNRTLSTSWVADGVAAEENLDVAVPNQLRQVRAGAAVNDGRAGDDQNLAAAGANLAHLLGDLLDDEALGMFG